MAVARKKARKKPEEQPVAALETHAPVTEQTTEKPKPAPAEKKAQRRRDAPKITLPSSGLASEILAREETEAIDITAIEASDATSSLPVPMETFTHAQNISFFATPSRDDKKPAEATEHLVTFYLGDEEYGLDVRLVQEIIRVAETTPVPRAPAHVKGVINLRGRIIPVIDLKLKLKLGDVDPQSRGTRIVVTKQRERLIGLLVDGASQVLKIPVSSIDSAPDEVVEHDAEYIRGVAKLEKRLIILMDLDHVLTMEPQTPSRIGMER